MTSLYAGGCAWCGFPLKELCSHPQCQAALKNGYCSVGCARAAVKVLMERIIKAVA